MYRKRRGRRGGSESERCLKREEERESCKLQKRTSIDKGDED